MVDPTDIVLEEIAGVCPADADWHVDEKEERSQTWCGKREQGHTIGSCTRPAGHLGAHHSHYGHRGKLRGDECVAVWRDQ